MDYDSTISELSKNITVQKNNSLDDDDLLFLIRNNFSMSLE